MFTCTVKLNGSGGFTQPHNGTVVLVLVQSQMGNHFVDWSVRLHSSRWLPALFQLLRPFSACSTISVSERERALGLDSGLETTFTWPRSHLGFQHSLVFSFLSALDVTVARAFKKPCCIVNFDPIFPSLRFISWVACLYVPIHFLFFCAIRSSGCQIWQTVFAVLVLSVSCSQHGLTWSWSCPGYGSVLIKPVLTPPILAMYLMIQFNCDSEGYDAINHDELRIAIRQSPNRLCNWPRPLRL